VNVRVTEDQFCRDARLQLRAFEFIIRVTIDILLCPINTDVRRVPGAILYQCSVGRMNACQVGLRPIELFGFM
jgi:hypothetical protein